MRKFHHIHLATLLVVLTWPARRPDTEIKFIGRFPFRKNNRKFRWEQKVEFPIGKKLFHLVVNPGTSRCPTVDLELVQTTRNVNGTRHSVRKFQPGKRAHLFGFSTFSGNIPVGRTDETCAIYRRTGNSEILTKWKAPKFYHLLPTAKITLQITHSDWSNLVTHTTCRDTVVSSFEHMLH